MARIAMMPACGLTTTLRPSPLPTMLRTASVSSVQKSDAELVVMRLLSFCRLVAAVLLPEVGAGVGAPG